MSAGRVGQAERVERDTAPADGMNEGVIWDPVALWARTRPDRLAIRMGEERWSYARPEVKVFVFDGQHSWFYVPAEKQVTISDLDDQKRSELPFLLIGDPAARDRFFAMREATRGGAVTVTLQPRSAAAMIRTINVTIARDTHLIQRVDYTDREGNRTTFDFAGYQRRSVTADLFRFTPPAGVEVVQAQ